MMDRTDIAFMGAKMATSKNEGASIAVHGVSAAYNIAQMARYRYEYCYGQRLLSNGFQVDMTQVKQYQQEMFKHSVLAMIDIASLLIIGLSGIHKKM